MVPGAAWGLSAEVVFLWRVVDLRHVVLAVYLGGACRVVGI